MIYYDMTSTYDGCIYEARSEVEINGFQCVHEAALIIWNVENGICLKTA